MLSCNIGVSQTVISEGFKLEVENAAKKLSLENPEFSDPVMVNASTVWNKSRDKVAVVVKASILSGWHIYAYVPQTQPYIQYDMVLEAPEGWEALGEWEAPKPYPYEQGIMIYKGIITFTKYFEVKNHSNKNLTAGLFYQTCNINQCLRPNQKVINLNI
ncbi:protein-disulfide reductase DsbD domain-containing protein [Aestuariibaculum marinum]|uniref:Thiol:disulfide interchange protein DsbD N-terminal domain-containing protein n=1 Tax=Aestuariibaculum marinum TaxID=2683592 RepID=A0A8J6U656_9FLAO|nr:protein-disulfide reductase DsbD domain-containing protein [Aestuariibaculum marinum]MBD0825475.1 hypothetical protein [Aestuariibaculum marinum]